MRGLIFGACVIVAAACGVSPPLEAFGEGPYRGKVIDAETKAPLVGAVVLVYWNLEAPAIGHGPSERFLDAEEVLTDGRGEFVVAKNPPRVKIPGTWLSEPDITIFYPGYGFFPNYHTSPPWPSMGYRGLLKMMEQESVVIALPPLRTREKRMEVVSLLPPTGLVPDLKMPNLLRLLNVERRNLGLPPRGSFKGIKEGEGKQ